MENELKGIASGERPETGPMCFEGDWPGVFIRGDNAYSYATVLRAVLRGEMHEDVEKEIWGLIALLQSCQVGGLHPVKIQSMPDYQKCHTGEVEFAHWYEIAEKLREEGKLKL